MLKPIEQIRRVIFGLITVQDNTMLKLNTMIKYRFPSLITVQDNTMLKQLR